MWRFLYNLFSPYTPYRKDREIIVSEEIYRDRYEIKEFNDPSQLESIPTGTYRDVTYEVWVAHHKGSGLSKFKHIKK